MNILENLDQQHLAPVNIYQYGKDYIAKPHKTVVLCKHTTPTPNDLKSGIKPCHIADHCILTHGRNSICPIPHIHNPEEMGRKQFPSTIKNLTIHQITAKLNAADPSDLHCLTCSKAKCTSGLSGFEELCPGHSPGALVISKRKLAQIPETKEQIVHRNANISLKIKQKEMRQMGLLPEKKRPQKEGTFMEGEYQEINLLNHFTATNSYLAYKMTEAVPEPTITPSYPNLRPRGKVFTPQADEAIEAIAGPHKLKEMSANIWAMREANNILGYDSERYSKIKEMEKTLRKQRWVAINKIINMKIDVRVFPSRAPKNSYAAKINQMTYQPPLYPASTKSSKLYWRDINETQRINKFMLDHGDRLKDVLELEPNHPIKNKLTQIDYNALAMVI